MKITNIISVLILILSFAIWMFFYDKMPDLMASHWNNVWVVDWYISKFWGLFMLPIISLILYITFLLIPKIDPLKANINEFKPYFDSFVLLLLIFLFYIYSITIYWNLWYIFDMNLMIIPALSVLFFYVWILLCNSKRNWFVGIRTPWTLSNDIVWDKTNKLWWILFKILWIISILSLFAWNNAYYFIVIPLVFFAITLIIYSYVEYWDQEIQK